MRSSASRNTSQWVLLGILCLINITITIVHLSRISLAKGLGAKTHTYIGLDYPLELPIDPLPAVEMTLQESVHFPLSGASTEAEWDTLSTNAHGLGWVRLGPDHRLFSTVLFHQLHCLQQLRRGLADRHHPDATPHHIRHCLNYLRQSILCAADGSLESGDFMARDYARERMGDTMQCVDWTRLYDWIGSNFVAWKKIRGLVIG